MQNLLAKFTVLCGLFILTSANSAFSQNWFYPEEESTIPKDVKVKMFAAAGNAIPDIRTKFIRIYDNGGKRVICGSIFHKQNFHYGSSYGGFIYVVDSDKFIFGPHLVSNATPAEMDSYIEYTKNYSIMCEG